VIGPRCAHPFEARYPFNVSGMSYGALSAPAVRALSLGAAEAGIWINTGEGGLAPYHLEGGGDIVFQIGTAKYGVRDAEGRLSDQRLREVAERVKAFEIKLSQGAKPGRGGVLPAHKVTAEIARIRGIPEGKVSSSPNRHPEIRSHLDLLCEEVVRLGPDFAPDFITVDGGEGGTGAAPQVLADHVALPIGEALPLLVDLLMEYGLKDRVRVIASGKLVDSGRVAWALCAGADFVVSARGFMFALGCIQSLQCHNNSCPTGITTHNQRLQKGLVVEEKARRVASYAHWVNHEVDRLAHACGLANARLFRREHVRIVQRAGHSLPLDQIYPYPHRLQRPI